MAVPSISAGSIAQARSKFAAVRTKGLDQGLVDTHEEVSDEIARGAARSVPVRSGRLRSSATVVADRAEATVKYGGTSAPYAPYVHWKFGPEFLTNASHKVEQDITARYDRRMADVFDEIIGK